MLRGCAVALTLLLGLAPLPATPAGPPLGRAEALAAARQFGAALRASDAAQLRSLLPRAGKVRVRLVRFGPAEGEFSGGQIEALFGDFLRQGAVRSFEPLNTEIVEGRYALVQSRVEVLDRSGAPVEVGVNLTLQPQDERWVLREVRETPP